MVPEEFEENMVDQVRFSLSENVLYKNLLTVMELFGSNDWERPIYYSTTVSSENYLNLEDYYPAGRTGPEGGTGADMPIPITWARWIPMTCIKS